MKLKIFDVKINPEYTIDLDKITDEQTKKSVLNLYVLYKYYLGRSYAFVEAVREK